MFNIAYTFQFLIVRLKFLAAHPGRPAKCVSIPYSTIKINAALSA